MRARRHWRSGLTLVTCGLLALAGGCVPENHLTGPLDESEYQLWANRYCSKQEAEIKDIPPPEGPRGHVRWAEKALERTELNARRRNMLDAPGDLQSLHDRASDLARQDTAETQRLIETKAPGDAKTAAQRLRRIRKQTPLTRELVYIYIQLELDQCVRLYTPVEEPGSRRPPVVESPGRTSDQSRGSLPSVGTSQRIFARNATSSALGPTKFATRGSWWANSKEKFGPTRRTERKLSLISMTRSER